MFRIVITDNVSYKIKKFTSSYFKVSLDLFTDCWIEDSKTIKENYIKKSYKFKSDIYISLNNHLSQEKILLKRKQKDSYISTAISLTNWNLFISYTEDKEQKIRFVEDIKFNRR